VTLQIVVSDNYRGVNNAPSLEPSIMLLENIFSSRVTHDDRHLRSSYFYSTGHMFHL
jgi:hypothetical protein